MKRSLAMLVIIVSLLLFLTAGMGVVSAQEEFPPAEGEALLEYVLTEKPYTEWGMWPDEKLQGFLNSAAPHGNVVRIFVNEEALAVADSFPGEMPARSIIVKENYASTDPASPGELDALTIMYKVPDYAPDSGNWFWIKAAGDGSTIDAEGTVEGCIACHSGVAGHKDYILRYGFDGEPAVSSAADLAAPAGGGEEEAEAAPESLPESGASSTVTSTILLTVLVGALLLGLALWLRRRRVTT